MGRCWGERDGGGHYNVATTLHSRRHDSLDLGHGDVYRRCLGGNERVGQCDVKHGGVGDCAGDGLGDRLLYSDRGGTSDGHTLFTVYIDNANIIICS